MFIARAAEILTDDPATWWRIKRFRDMYYMVVVPPVWVEGVLLGVRHRQFMTPMEELFFWAGLLLLVAENVRGILKMYNRTRPCT